MTFASAQDVHFGDPMEHRPGSSPSASSFEQWQESNKLDQELIKLRLVLEQTGRWRRLQEAQVK